MNSHPHSRFLLLLLLVLTCLPEEQIVQPVRNKYFEDLVYSKAVAKYKQSMEKRFEARDNSYVLSVLSYAVTSFYNSELQDARQAFTAAYKVDDGRIPEAAKFYQWLQVDARKVYRLSKRERELTHLYLGLVYLFEDNLEESLVEFKKLRQHDQQASELPLVNFYMGLVYEKMGQYDDALIEYSGLKDMGFHGRHSSLNAEVLVRRVEALRDGTAEPEADKAELVIHVDHQFMGSVGKTVVYADGEQIATLPPYVDGFEVKLTQAEASREALQDAGAQATREGIRFLAELLAKQLFKQDGAEIADVATEIAFGEENRNKDTRFWSYAPVAVSVVRTEIPVTTSEVRLEFFDREGGRIGSARHPLTGEHARAHYAADVYFVVAGLAGEFYVY